MNSQRRFISTRVGLQFSESDSESLEMSNKRGLLFYVKYHSQIRFHCHFLHHSGLIHRLKLYLENYLLTQYL